MERQKKKMLIWVVIFWTLLLIINTAIARCEITSIKIPKSVPQGGVLKIEIFTPETDPYKISVKFAEEKIEYQTKSFPIEKNFQIALVPIEALAKTGVVEIEVSQNGAIKILKKTEISKVYFPISRNIFPIGPITKRREKEIKFLKEIYARDTDKNFFGRDIKFSTPLKILEIVSPFGVMRRKKYSGIDEIQFVPHGGIDFRARARTPVFAVEDGVVAVAKNLSGSGNTIILDHGHGVMSLYFHLSKFKVKTRQVVKKDKIIALSGKSGTANGPHLHFETRIFGTPINPEAFFEGIGGK